MTREIICYEGKHPVNGKSIELGALTWDDKPLPLVSNPAVGVSSLVGIARDLKREDDGAITADLYFLEHSADVLTELPFGWGWTIYATKIVQEDKVIKAGLIREIFYAPDLPWGRK